MGARCAARHSRRRAPRTRGGDQAPSGRIQSAERSHSRHVCRQARRVGGHGLLRSNVEPVARGAESLPARDRTAPERRQILSGRRRRASRACPQRPTAVCEANAARKTPPAHFVLSNCTWEGGEVVATFRQPFELLAETATTVARIEAGEKAKSAKSEIWLGDLDSNQD